MTLAVLCLIVFATGVVVGLSIADWQDEAIERERVCWYHRSSVEGMGVVSVSSPAHDYRWGFCTRCGRRERIGW